MTFVEYCKEMDLLNYTLLSVGINEISEKQLKLEWTNQETKLARLLNLAKQFGAEIDFDTKLHADSSIKSIHCKMYIMRTMVSIKVLDEKEQTSA